MAFTSQPGQRLLVTGGAGFIGSCFVKQAVQAGHQIVVLDALTYAGHRENLEPKTSAKSPGSWSLVEGNICDSALVEKLFREYTFDAVINFAAESHVDRSIHAPGAFIQTNIVGTFTLLSVAREFWKALPAVRQAAFRFLHVSTDEVYGSLGPEGYFTEQSLIAPNSPYSASKASADLLVRAWHHTYGLPTLVTNCSNNYGPRQFPEKLIPHMILCALKGKPLPVYGDGKNIRDWIHVEDHCNGIALALSQGRPGETYCFGGRSERGNLDVVRAICAQLDQDKPRSDSRPHASAIQFVEDRLGHDRRYAIDDAKAENELGFTRKYKSFEAGLQSTVAWYLENETWCNHVSKKAEK